MAKQKKVPKKEEKVDRFALIEASLKKKTKSDLVGLLLATAKFSDDTCRELEIWLNIDKPVDLLVADVSSAIDRATTVDERMLNRNFDVDWLAYEEVELGFEKLIAHSELTHVKSLALEMMKRGSYQVECSEEGIMTEDIEACLKPVIRAVEAGDVAAAKPWAAAMLAADCVGFICDSELKKLSGKKKMNANG